MVRVAPFFDSRCIYILGALARPPNGILTAAKLTLRPSLAFSYIGSVAARQKIPNFTVGHPFP